MGIPCPGDLLERAGFTSENYGSVVDDLPDPPLAENRQVDRIKQGVGGSQSGPYTSPDPEKWGIGARIGPRSGLESGAKKGGPEQGIYGVGAGTGSWGAENFFSERL